MADIIIITPYFAPAQCGGGGQVSVENLAYLLSDYECLTVICYNRDYGSSTKLTEVTHKKTGKLTIIYFTFADLLKVVKLIDYNPRIIYFNSFFSPICIFFQFYFFFSKSIKIISPKGEFYDGAVKEKATKKTIWLQLFKVIFGHRRFHATSTQEVTSIEKYIHNSSIIVARDIPTKSYSELTYKGRKDNRLRVVYVSRIDAKKNLKFISNLFQDLDLELEFDIWGEIGDQTYFDECLEEFKKLKKNIIWSYKGKLNFNDARAIFINYDLFLFPTRGENYGHVIFESLSCGCPVFLSKDTTPWNDLEEHSVGFNIPLSDFNLWAEKITWYKATLTESTREQLFNACTSYIKQKIDLVSIENENLNLFRR